MHRGFQQLKNNRKNKTNPEATYGLSPRPFNNQPFHLSLVSFFYLTVKAICFSSREREQFTGSVFSFFFNRTHAHTCCTHIIKASQPHTHTCTERALQSYISIQHYLKTFRHSWAGISPEASLCRGTTWWSGAGRWGDRPHGRGDLDCDILPLESSSSATHMKPISRDVCSRTAHSSPAYKSHHHAIAGLTWLKHACTRAHALTRLCSNNQTVICIEALSKVKSNLHTFCCLCTLTNQ